MVLQITVLDVERQEPVDIQAIPKDRWDLACCLCRQRMGAKIQCAYGDCCTAYHPLCARLAGEGASRCGRGVALAHNWGGSGSRGMLCYSQAMV